MEPGQLPLRDIHLPEAIGWWPLAPGWWIVAILVPLTIGLIISLYKRITRNTAIKAAKKLLSQYTQDIQLDNSQKLQAISALIRRVAISTGNRKECAGLTGQRWLEFLDGSLKGTPFSGGIGQLLVSTAYQKNALSDQEISQLARLCEDWLKAQTKRKK